MATTTATVTAATATVTAATTTAAAAVTESSPSARPGTVDRLLELIADGRGAAVAELCAEGAVLDATVPGWRFHCRGPQAIAEQYARWFANPGRFEELDRQVVHDGEVVTYLVASEEGGVPFAAHHCHRITLDADGRITGDRFFCGGRWDAALLAAMEEADHAH